MKTQWPLWTIWLTTFVAGSGLLHWYFWRRFLKDPALPNRWVRSFGWAFVAFTLMLPCSFWMRRHFVKPLDSVAFLVMVTWMATVYFLVCLRFVAGIIPAAIRIGAILGVSRPYDPARRLFLSRALAAGTLSVGIPGLIFGSREAQIIPEIREIEVKLDKLPATKRGFTIVQLTDMHVANWTSADFIAGLVERTNSLKPDLVALTGDIVDGDIDHILPKISSLRNLKATYGVFGVTGNHEYYVGSQAWLPAFEQMGIAILQNEGRIVGDAIFLAGVPDRTAFRIPGEIAPDIKLALANRPSDAPAVLMVHQPREIAVASGSGVDLQISGHTHGGQVWPFGALVMAAQPYLSGLHLHDRTQIYVSRGAGSWGPPLRIAAPTEISKIVLV